MKCTKCGGTGFVPTNIFGVNGAIKCDFCDGTGEYEPFDLDVELDKLYPTEQTNEEWFCALPTKDKAKFLEAQQKHGGTIAARSDVDWEVWLKEKHE